MIAPSSDIGDFLGDVGSSIADEIKHAATDAVTKVRTDVADAVNTIGAGVSTAAAGAIAPARARPVSIPLTSKQLGVIALAGAAILITLIVLLTGHARR
ncbi:MAG TPA: hypothetical protein VI231_22275 [Candidatus Binatia bacterium]|jgi:hypothetical protein